MENFGLGLSSSSASEMYEAAEVSKSQIRHQPDFNIYVGSNYSIVVNILYIIGYVFEY